MTTRRNNDRVALRDILRKKFPGGPREALRTLGLDKPAVDAVLALDGANTMPNRLQYLAIMRTAAALNPLLAVDAKVDANMPAIYGNLVAGEVMTANAIVEGTAAYLNTLAPNSGAIILVLEPLIDGLERKGFCFATLRERPDFKSHAVQSAVTPVQ